MGCSGDSPPSDKKRKNEENIFNTPFPKKAVEVYLLFYLFILVSYLIYLIYYSNLFIYLH